MQEILSLNRISPTYDLLRCITREESRSTECETYTLYLIYLRVAGWRLLAEQVLGDGSVCPLGVASSCSCSSSSGEWLVGALGMSRTKRHIYHQDYD